MYTYGWTYVYIYHAIPEMLDRRRGDSLTDCVDMTWLIHVCDMTHSYESCHTWITYIWTLQELLEQAALQTVMQALLHANVTRYIYMYIYTYLYMYTHTHKHIFLHVYIFFDIPSCKRCCMQMRLGTTKYIYIYAYAYVYIYIYIYMYIYICAHVHICIYLCVYMYFYHANVTRYY